jgi:glycosyltransferase involved in cell wall biosynthesis
MRIIALLASYNERRFIEPCLAHLHRHGVDAYLIDNGSTDNTVEIAETWLDRNLLGIESFPRGKGDVYDWRGLLRRKEELAREFDADWFIHQDPDEAPLPPGQFRMKHYLILSVPHAIEKYVERRYSPEEVESGWHGWRARVTADDIRLPSRSELRVSLSDDDLDPGEPRKSHYVDNPA